MSPVFDRSRLRGGQRASEFHANLSFEVADDRVRFIDSSRGRQPARAFRNTRPQPPHNDCAYRAKKNYPTPAVKSERL